MASPVSSIFGASPSTTGTATTTASAAGPAPNEQMFLQLLVSQIKNQDPLNPVDGTQFVSQLAQFSELEQLIAIRGDMDQQNAAMSSVTPTTNTNAPASTSNTTAGGSTSAAPPSTPTPQN